MGGGSGGSSGTQRYADYVEQYHRNLLIDHNVFKNVIIGGTNTNNGPYQVSDIVDPDNSLVGAGLSIDDYPSLYATFETLVTDLDIDSLYNTILAEMIDNAAINESVAAEYTYIDDTINQVSLPKVNAGYRDINAVMSTGFMHGKAFLEAQKIKTISKYSADLRIKGMNDALVRWTETMKWNLANIDTYMKLNQYYWASRYDYVDAKNDVAHKGQVWPFTVLDFSRSFIGTLQGGSPSVGGPSKAQKAITGTLGGAAAGAYIGAQLGTVGGLPGVAVGAAVGGLLGLAGGLL